MLEKLRSKYLVGFIVGFILAVILFVYMNHREKIKQIEYLQNYEVNELNRLGLNCEQLVVELKGSLGKEFKKIDSKGVRLVSHRLSIEDLKQQYIQYKESFFHCARLSASESRSLYRPKYQLIYQTLSSMLTTITDSNEIDRPKLLRADIDSLEILLTEK